MFPDSPTVVVYAVSGSRAQSWRRCGDRWCAVLRLARRRGRSGQRSNWGCNPHYVRAVGRGQNNQYKDSRPLYFLQTVWNQVQAEIAAGKTGYDLERNNCVENAIRILQASGASDLSGEDTKGKTPAKVFNDVKVLADLQSTHYDKSPCSCPKKK